MNIGDLDLSVRASNCLESAKIQTVGELLDWTEPELLKLRSFGKTSLREIKRKLADIGLGMGGASPAAAAGGNDDEADDDAAPEAGAEPVSTPADGPLGASQQGD